ncbi:hypothetical protein ACFZAE_00245 [Streptomyces scabiei]|uniref:hypothetical protein n=1 Tax=Streptomyces scabiei TaxID=1930 RepID=UPI0036E88107
MNDIASETPDEVSGGSRAPGRAELLVARGPRAGVAFRGALVLAAIVSVGSCGSPEPRGSSPGPDSAPGGCEIRDTTQQVADRFSALGRVVTAEWCAMDLSGGSSRVPGPTDIRMVGSFETTAEDMKAVLDAPGRTFEKDGPEDIPDALSASMPENHEWLTSSDVDEEITQGLYTAAFYFDPASNRILFDTVNPTRTDDEAVVAGG